MDADNTKEYGNWQNEDSMVRLRYCNQWPYKDCLSKSVLDGHYPTYGRTPLHSAVLGNYEEVVKELLDNRVGSAADYKGQTAPYLVT
jgi:hypothetical protein